MPDPAVVSVTWLRANLDAPGIRVLDGSWHMPASERNAAEEFVQKSIPGAAFFDIERVAATESDLPHTYPSADQFATAMQSLGIRNSDFVVVYDSVGLFSAPRVWWLLRLFGHRRVAVLHGGLPAWEDSGLATSPGNPPPPGDERFTTHFNPDLLATFDQTLRAVRDSQTTLLDARSPGRFAGSEPEPRIGLPSGHMPGARNLPFNNLLDPGTGALRPSEELRKVFGEQLLESEGEIITSCGSGVTACVLALGLHTLGRTARVYDGSWCEWATRAPGDIQISAS